MGSVSLKVTSLLKKNRTKYYKPTHGREKEPRRPKITKISKGNIIKGVRSVFKQKKDNKAIKYKIMRDIRNLSELGKDHSKQ